MLRLSRLNRWKTEDHPVKPKKANVQPGETRTIVIAIISRMVLTPILLLPLMAIGARYDNPKLFDE